MLTHSLLWRKLSKVAEHGVFCSLYRDFSAFNSLAPGSAGSLQAQLNGTIIPTTNSYAFITAKLPPASVIAIVRSVDLFLEDLDSTAADYQEGQLLSIA